MTFTCGRTAQGYSGLLRQRGTRQSGTLLPDVCGGGSGSTLPFNLQYKQAIATMLIDSESASIGDLAPRHVWLWLR